MQNVRGSIRLLLSFAGLLAIGVALRSAEAERPAPAAIEIRQPGHDPSARWRAGGVLSMVFVREDAGGGRLYYADSSRGSAASAAIAVSPPGLAVVGQAQTGPSLEILPDGTMVAVYSASVPANQKQKHGSAVRAQRSTDAGATWSAPVPVNDDQAAGPHGWLSTAVDSSGGVQVVWLDKRGAEQGLIWTRTGDGIRFESNRVLDPRVCFCCATSLLAAADGRSGISYRDLEGKDLRNIAMVARARDGRFTAPAVVSDDGWRLDGCPDSGPRMALAPGGGVWAVWFNGAAPGVFSAFSPDGARFSPRLQVAGPGADGAVPNHPEIAVLPDRTVVALYVSRSTVLGRQLSRDGKSWAEALRLVEGAAEPRIAVGAGRSAVSYTAHSGNDLVAVAETKSLERLAGGAR